MTTRREIINKIKEAIKSNDIASYLKWAEEQLLEICMIVQIITEIGGKVWELKLIREYNEGEIPKEDLEFLEVMLDTLTKFSSFKEAYYYAYKKGVLELP